VKIQNRMSGYGVIRNGVQILFLITVLVIGYKFYLFASHLESGVIPLTERPPGVEGFLPIGALVSLKYYILTGTVNTIHPSGFYLFVFILSVSFLFKKSFCSWVCPIGFLSEQLTVIHRKIFKRSLKLPRYPDILLRAVKYLILAFFLWSILFKMNAFVLEKFIHSSYNVISDFKMLKFFTEMTFKTGLVILVLVVLSVVIKQFWCRYLCPYGGLLGFISLFSPFKIRRNHTFCTSCRKCDHVCPSDISVSRSDAVLSDECTGCGSCQDACPEKGALSFSLPDGKIPLKPVFIALLLVSIFGGGSVYLDARDKWQNSIQKQEYFYHLMNQGLLDIKNLENPKTFIENLDQKSRIEFMRQMMQKD